MNFILTLMLALSSVVAFAQDAQKPYAVIHEYDASFVQSSPASGTYRLRTRVEVKDRKGLDAAVFTAYTDSFRSLTSFSGRIEAAGKTLKKLKMSDIETFSAVNGIASDAFVSYYEPSAPYPFIVEYEYEISYRKGFISYPVFFPVSDPLVSLKSASYVLDVPSGTEIQYNASAEPESGDDGKRRTISWNFADVECFTYEHMMPDIIEFVPYVYSAPSDFQYSGTKGSQYSWKDSGLWLSSLQNDVKNIPDELKNTVDRLISGVNDVKSKIKILYDYLRENTRYVSIQLGLGGLKPFPVETVTKTGFGDCKALSIYMQALLTAAGIDSDYLVVNTSRSRFVPGYYSVGQMNHAMLSVPVGKDTIVVECTNPRLPLGYSHDRIAGHEVLLIKDDGGELIRVPSYPDSLRMLSQQVKVCLAPDGTAECEGCRLLNLDAVEGYVGFESFEAQDQFDVIMGGTTLNPSAFKVVSVNDNFNDWATTEGMYVPQMKIAYSCKVMDYSSVSSDRMFVQLNPFAKLLPVERAERRYDFIRGLGRTYVDSVEFILPEGFVPESMPDPGVVDTPFGKFATEIRYECDDQGLGRIMVVQTLELIPGRFTKEQYDDYRNFARNVSRIYSSKVILKKQ